MRTIPEVQADIAKLGRPTHPASQGTLVPRSLGQRHGSWPGAIAKWREELELWKRNNPSGPERYELLLEEWESIERAMVKSKAARARVSECGVPKRVEAALCLAKPTFPLKAAEAWVDGPKQYLVLAGAVGTGKSVAAGHALVRLMERGVSGAWVAAGSIATIAGGFNGMAEMERLKHVDVLVVDDFGTEHLSSFAESVFFEMLAARHENENRTVFTHNLEKPVFRERLRSRLADRVASSCSYVECAGASLRGGQ